MRFQSFTTAPPERARILSLSSFQADQRNRPEVHEWRTGSSSGKAVTQGMQIYKRTYGPHPMSWWGGFRS